MLKQFHFIDQNGKDQGINVRNRSAELAKLLGDVEQIRQERKKARSNKNKYGGVEGGAGLGGGFASGGSRYGGFGSESGNFGGGGYGGEVYGDGGGFGGEDPDLRFQNTQKRGDDYEEYDAGADDDSRPPKRSVPTSSSSRVKKEPAAPKPKEPVKDLFSFDDEPVPVSKPAQPVTQIVDDDEFDDFQSATSPAPVQSNPLASFAPPTSIPTSSTQFAAPQPVAPPPMNSILSAPSPAPSASSTTASVTSPITKPIQPASFKPSGPNYFTSVRADINTSSQPSAFSSRTPSAAPSTFSSPSTTTMASLGKPDNKPAAKPSGGDAFGSIWSSASTKAGVQQKSIASKGPGMAAMQKEKSAAGIWGAATTTQPVQNTQSQKPATPLGNGLDDLLG